jgi:hypothetical protein
MGPRHPGNTLPLAVYIGRSKKNFSANPEKYNHRSGAIPIWRGGTMGFLKASPSVSFGDRCIAIQNKSPGSKTGAFVSK